MKKYFVSVLMLTLLALFAGCRTNETNTLWAPPVQGLEWGMSPQRAIEILDCEGSYEQKQEDTVQLVTVSGSHKLIWGVSVEELTMKFDDNSQYLDGYQGLVEVSAKCREEDIPKLKEKINKEYASYRKTDDFSNFTQWDAEIVQTLPDFEQLEKSLSAKLGSYEFYDAYKKGFEGAPLARIRLEESGERAGLISVSGKEQLLVDALRADDSAQVSSSSEAASDSSSSETPTSSSSTAESDSSSEEVANALLSVHLEQREHIGWLNWELDITDAEEMKLLEELLSVDELSPRKMGDWPDGGTGIDFKLEYIDGTVEGCCNPYYADQYEDGRSIIVVGENIYYYPGETGDKLMEFLKSKNITVTG